MSEGNAAVTQADTTAAREWFDQAERDGMIRRGSRKDIPLVRLLAHHRALGASEERARSATTSDETARLLDGLLASSGARGRYHAREYAAAVSAAESHLAALQSQDIPS